MEILKSGEIFGRNHKIVLKQLFFNFNICYINFFKKQAVVNLSEITLLDSKMYVLQDTLYRPYIKQ